MARDMLGMETGMGRVMEKIERKAKRCQDEKLGDTEYSRYRHTRYKNILVTSIPSPVPHSK